MPALKLGELPKDSVMYINNGPFQPLCNKLKRLAITCVFVAAKVRERPFVVARQYTPNTVFQLSWSK